MRGAILLLLVASIISFPIKTLAVEKACKYKIENYNHYYFYKLEELGILTSLIDGKKLQKNRYFSFKVASDVNSEALLIIENIDSLETVEGMKIEVIEKPSCKIAFKIIGTQSPSNNIEIDYDHETKTLSYLFKNLQLKESINYFINIKSMDKKIFRGVDNIALEIKDLDFIAEEQEDSQSQTHKSRISANHLTIFNSLDLNNNEYIDTEELVRFRIEYVKYIYYKLYKQFYNIELDIPLIDESFIDLDKDGFISFLSRDLSESIDMIRSINDDELLLLSSWLSSITSFIDGNDAKTNITDFENLHIYNQENFKLHDIDDNGIVSDLEKKIIEQSKSPCAKYLTFK